MYARTRSDQMRIDCSAIFVDVANFPAEHIRHRLSVGRGLHNDRRRGRNGCLGGRECGHRPDCNRSGGHLRGCWRDGGLGRGRLSGFGGPCLRKRQRRNHCASKSNSCSSHVFSFVELTFTGCFGARVPFGCLDRPCSRTSDSDTEESALSGHAAPRASSTGPKINETPDDVIEGTLPVPRKSTSRAKRWQLSCVGASSASGLKSRLNVASCFLVSKKSCS